MRQIAIVTLFPEMFDAVKNCGVSGRALAQGAVELAFISPRDFAHDKHRCVDDRPYGGGPGMVLKVQPMRDAIAAAHDHLGGTAHTIYLTPQGRRLQQQRVSELAAMDKLVLVAGRYEGVDARLIESCIDEELSVGDFILSGGELPAMLVIDAILRLLPGSLRHPDSASQDSFSRGLLDFPDFTRPEEIDGRRVPEVLLSGDHEAIARWRLKQSLGRTWLKRPDLLAATKLDPEERTLLTEFIDEYRGSGVRD